jgi:hypothetical protein
MSVWKFSFLLLLVEASIEPSVDSLNIEIEQLNSLTELLEALVKLTDNVKASIPDLYKALNPAIQNARALGVRDTEVASKTRKGTAGNFIFIPNLVPAIRNFSNQIAPVSRSTAENVLTYCQTIQVKISAWMVFAEKSEEDAPSTYKKDASSIIKGIFNLIPTQNLQILKKSIDILNSFFYITIKDLPEFESAFDAILNPASNELCEIVPNPGLSYTRITVFEQYWSSHKSERIKTQILNQIKSSCVEDSLVKLQNFIKNADFKSDQKQIAAQKLKRGLEILQILENKQSK